jgi:predicted kinase
MRGIYWLPKQEKLISQWEYNSIRTALQLGYNVVADSTNLNLATIAALTAIAIDCGAELEFKLIEADLDECIKRDSLRPNPVGANIIRNFYNKYISHE